MTLEEIREKRKNLDKQILELNKQEEELLEAERDIKRGKRNELIRKMQENKDLVLSMFPNHDRTSCDDVHVNNGFYSSGIGCRCARCGILQLLEDDFPSNLEIRFDVTFGEL